MNVLYLIIYFLIAYIIIKIIKKISYSKQTGAVVLGRRNNTIYTAPTLKGIIRYIKNGEDEFKKDCKEFFDNLEKEKIYITDSHLLILKEIKKRDTDVIYAKTKKRRMILVKLIIGNRKRLFQETQYYKICFKIRKS
jgi:hypothetical protein